MRLVKLAFASVNTTVGAVRTNADRAIRTARAMAKAEVTLGAFQEQLLGGYPPEDLVQWGSFVEAQRLELERFAAETASLGTIFVLGLTVAREAHRYNAAALVHRGKVLGVVPKEELPTYNVFYEARTFSQGIPYQDWLLWDSVPFGDLVFECEWGKLAVEVCEDIWSPDGPMRRRAYSGAEVVVNISASPFRIGVEATRREMVATRSADNQCTVVYANAVGCQDGLIFDGGGFVCQNGRLVTTAPRFVEGWQAAVVDLDRTTRLRAENTTWRQDALRFHSLERKVKVVRMPGACASRSSLAYPAPKERSFFLPATRPATDARSEFCEELLDALALGVGDYFEKNRFRLIGVALSGGRDSLLTILIAWRYVQKSGKKVADVMRAFYMPSRFSSAKTRSASERTAADLGVPFEVIPIDDALESELAAAKKMLRPGEEITPITLQNIQARLRGARMWNWSNATAGLFLQTGNMSEKAVGYTTIGGDLEGGLSVISNLPKTVVIYLLEYLLERHGFEGIRQVLALPAGPELAAEQESEKELMPFQILDACFALYAGEKLSPDELVLALASMFPEVKRDTLASHASRFVRLFSQSIYKWVQAPLGLHVGNLDLDRERALQIPVVTSPEWQARPKT